MANVARSRAARNDADPHFLMRLFPAAQRENPNLDARNPNLDHGRLSTLPRIRYPLGVGTRAGCRSLTAVWTTERDPGGGREV